MSWGEMIRNNTFGTIMKAGQPSNTEDDPEWWKRIWGHWNYYRAFSAWLVFCSLVGSTYSLSDSYIYKVYVANIFLVYLLTALIAIVLSSLNEDLSFLDGLFLSVSAMTSTGLATVSMSTLSPASFVVLAVLILLGGSLALPLAPLLYRRHVYGQIKSRYPPDV